MTRPLRSRRWHRAALLVVALLPRLAYADDVASAAEAAVQRGIELRRAGRNGEALVQFQSAYALAPTPRAKAQIALALHALGDWLGAERELEGALRAADDPWIAQYRKELEGALATVRAHLGRLYIDIDVAEAQLLLDGVTVHALPTTDPIRVREGTLHVEVRAPGYLTVRRNVDVAAGTEVHEAFSLEPLTQPPPTAADVALPALVRSPPPEPRSRAALYVAFGAAVALSAGGVVAWREHEGDLAVYNDDSRCLVPGPLNRAQQCGGYNNAAYLALGVEIGAFAASALAAGVGAWLLWAPSGRRPSRSAAGWCGWDGALGLSCGGRF